MIICFVANAQDTIFLKNGEEIKSKIKEVTSSEVKYVKYENLDGPIYSLSKAQILMIKYENGSKDIFEEKESYIEVTPNIKPKSTAQLSDVELAKKGTQDAEFYYKGKNSGKTGVLLTSLLLNGIFGLIPAIPCSLTKPNIQNLNLPNPELYRTSANYSIAYDKQAKKIKTRKIWTNYAIGTAISTIFYIAATSSN
jgi:hypothetical protein